MKEDKAPEAKATKAAKAPKAPQAVKEEIVPVCSTSKRDVLPKIIEELDVMHKEMVRERNIFKARAYDKVLGQLRVLNKPVYCYTDITENGIIGIGDGIKKKIEEIIATGALEVAEQIKQNPTISFNQELLKIYGIGPVKAKALINDKTHKMTSIAELREAVAKDPSLLNDKQKIGLKYFEDINLRIPREEMEEHEKLIEQTFKSVDQRFVATIVGSYRRKAESSGDIDVLAMLPSEVDDKEADKLFAKAVKKFQENEYISDILALGQKKCMAMSRIPGSNKRARRLDILLTPPEEYPFALLYFTGSDKFNIVFRKKTLAMGYSLSEHGLKKMKTDIPDAPIFKREEDIFEFFKIPYVAPDKR